MGGIFRSTVQTDMYGIHVFHVFSLSVNLCNLKRPTSADAEFPPQLVDYFELRCENCVHELARRPCDSARFYEHAMLTGRT